ncbi:hypothetical protein Aperf_G00000057365 [Anoplocephala perfoliata]
MLKKKDFNLLFVTSLFLCTLAQFDDDCYDDEIFDELDICDEPDICDESNICDEPDICVDELDIGPILLFVTSLLLGVRAQYDDDCFDEMFDEPEFWDELCGMDDDGFWDDCDPDFENCDLVCDTDWQPPSGRYPKRFPHRYGNKFRRRRSITTVTTTVNPKTTTTSTTTTTTTASTTTTKRPSILRRILDALG